MDVADRLSSLMAALGLTAKEVSERSGLSKASLSRYLSRQRTRIALQDIRKLEEALGVPYGSLESDQQMPPSLAAYLETELAKEWQPPLSDQEILLLILSRWYAPGEEPTATAWHDVIRARRNLRKKEKCDTTGDAGGP